ncbi:MAG: cobyrinate a,c-diamide synthase [Anaerovoracaceae bacterium]
MTVNRTWNLPRLLIGATGSGSGKTTLTCGLLKLLQLNGKKPVSFKCGPDYIDPMFHREVLGVDSRNLDLFFNDEETIKFLMAQNSKGAELVVIEGVMGFYDGLAGTTPIASAYDLARKTKTPTILLVDGRGKSYSILAEIKGFLELKSDGTIKGVILNRVSDMMYPRLKALIEENLPVKVVGYMRNLGEHLLESRHLGLVTAGEIEHLDALLEGVARSLAETIDLEGVMELAQGASPFSYVSHQLPSLPVQEDGEPLRFAVARDKAFCFYYEDNLDLLRAYNGEIVEFSPMKDPHLPENIHGLILGGGYPELYLQELEANVSMRREIRRAVEGGLPTLAECGGFMYLHREIEDQNRRAFAGVGVLEGRSFPTDKLVRFGYITLRAKGETSFLEEGETIKAHEFHYWDSTDPGGDFRGEKPLSNRGWDCIHEKGNLLCGYPHLNFHSNLNIVKKIVSKAIAYKRGL